MKKYKDLKGYEEKEKELRAEKRKLVKANMEKWPISWVDHLVFVKSGNRKYYDDMDLEVALEILDREDER